ncbi:MAG: oligosaccharide flippase family protein [Bacteroidales bacterium]
MSDNGSTYGRIIKATGIFGGVQVINMICSLVRNKIIAVWLGAYGIGVIGLFGSAMEMVMSATSLGLRQSGVREVSVAKGSGVRLPHIIAVLRRLSLLAGLLGAITFLAAAPLLSRFTFGSDKQLWGFVWLSCALLFSTLTLGEQAVLQGTGRLKALAKASVAGSLVSLAISVPIYYFLGIEGIVPSLILTSLFTLFFTVLYSRKGEKSTNPISFKKAISDGKPMMRLGIFMTVSGFVTTLLNYMLVAWLNYYSSTSEVGYYQAGFTLVTRYVGLIFAAMATEYYPRLSAASSDNALMSVQASRQMETSLLLLLPITSVFLLLQEWIIPLLYAPEFICITTYTGWAMLGVAFKAVSWSLGFVLLAKGNGKLFLITEILSDTTSFGINIFLYLLFGFDGLGIGYMLNFILYGILIWWLCSKYYNFRPERRFYIVFVITLLITFFVFYLVSFSTVISYYAASLLCAIAVVYSFLSLKKRLAR